MLSGWKIGMEEKTRRFEDFLTRVHSGHMGERTIPEYGVTYPSGRTPGSLEEVDEMDSEGLLAWRTCQSCW